MTSRGRTRDLLLDLLDATDLAVDHVDEWKWMTMLSGEWKRTIPVLFHIDERSLHTTTLLAGVPDEGHEEVYEILLQKNQDPSPVHFALDDEGDIILTGHLPHGAVDERMLDELLGAILQTCDDVFNRVLRAGFAGYIEVEQRWREKNDLPPNPVSSAP